MSRMPPHPLQYAQRPRVLRSRWMRRWIVLVALAAVGCWLLAYGPYYWEHVCQNYWYYHQCVTYTAPPDQVVYKEDAAATAAKYPQAPGRRFVPLPFRQPVVSVSVIPQCWADFSSVNDPQPATQSVLFLHERTSPMGERELVAVTFGGWNGAWWSLNIRLESQGFNTHRASAGIWSEYHGHFDNSPGTLQFFAGQIDPADASRFTIDYVYNGKRGTLDGRLTLDGWVQISYRDPHAMRAARP